MKIAVFGCIHGDFDQIYNKVELFEKEKNWNIDLILVCGDLQTVRNENDLKCVAIPKKYHQLGSFYKYYFGEKMAPKLTILIGGNHEASNYLQTLPYGGWVAPKMYYLGYSSVIRFGGLRIGGISGIYNQKNCHFEHFECLPYDNNTMRSVYHMREMEIYKFLQLNTSLDIFLSHDWPINIDKCATPKDQIQLKRKKPHFVEEMQTSRLGNPLLSPLVNHLKPKYWFSAHLHVGFKATVEHYHQKDNKMITRFQALDKIGPHRYYFHWLDIPIEQKETFKLEYDPEWLAILKKTDDIWKESMDKNNIDLNNCINILNITQSDIDQIKQIFENNLEITEEMFEKCSPVLEINEDLDPERQNNYQNVQTIKFCKKLNISDPNETFIININNDLIKNPDEIDLSDDDEDDQLPNKKQKSNENEEKEEEFFIIDTKGTLS